MAVPVAGTEAALRRGISASSCREALGARDAPKPESCQGHPVLGHGSPCVAECPSVPSCLLHLRLRLQPSPPLLSPSGWEKPGAASPHGAELNVP